MAQGQIASINIDTDETISKLSVILKFVLENRHSNFYTNKYKNQLPIEINNYENFKKLPFLIKDEFLAAGLKSRTFIPEDKIAYYSFSSGTTRQKKVAITPFDSFDHEQPFFFNEDEVCKLGVKNILMLLPSFSPQFIKHLLIPEKFTLTIPGDINNLNLMAEIIKEIDIQGIITTPTILDSFTDCLKEDKKSLERIKWISLSGEFCSAQKAEYFKSIFQNGFLSFRYGSAEIGLRGYRCRNLSDNFSPNVFHPAPHTFLEIIDEAGKTLPMNEVGEIIHTDLKEKAFPLIRYKSGDVGALAKIKCSCENNFILILGGRAGYDFLKFSGATIHNQMIENSLNSVRQFIEPRFQMHVFEERANGKIKPKLQLHLQLRKKFQNNKESLSLITELKEKIGENLRLSMKSNLKQLVENGSFLPLEITFVDGWPKDAAKTKNIISHLR